MITDFQESRHALLTMDDVTVHLYATPYQAMAFLQPFWELYNFRQRLGFSTYISLGSSNWIADILPKDAQMTSVSGRHTVGIHVNGQCESYLQDFRSQLHVPKKEWRTTIFPLESFPAFSQTMQRRREQPWVPYTMEAMPARILLLPLSNGNTAESVFGNYHLYRELCSSILFSLNRLNAQPLTVHQHDFTFFDVCSSHLFHDSTIFTTAIASLQELAFAILSSTLVVAMESECALLASMLSVPTLTIYGKDLTMEQHQLADKSLPNYSFSTEDVSKVTPTYVHSKLNQIVSNLYSLS